MTGPAPGLLEAALELARCAGESALRHFRREIAVERKADGSPVTIADRDAERLAREWIARRFPADAILGEEFGATAGTSGRCWLIDPVDGTRSFVRGVPLWGTLVAIVEHDTVLAGAAVYPAVGEELAAAPGQGTWHNGRRSRVSQVGELAEATVLVTDEYGFRDSAARRAWHRLAGQAGTARTWGDCYGYLLVATGRAEVMVDARLNPWDSACFVPIITEAGGTMTDLRGAGGWNLPDAIATNAAIGAAARQCFAG
jgi:histidinol phosphatase-like enzyme (inositol monophosphatase family)